MSALLIRGLSVQDRRKLQKMAESQNVSMNQWLVRLIHSEFHKAETEAEKEAEHKAAFRRIRELQREVAKKYPFQEDSTLLIRQMRDELSRKYDKDRP